MFSIENQLIVKRNDASIVGLVAGDSIGIQLVVLNNFSDQEMEMQWHVVKDVKEPLLSHFN